MSALMVDEAEVDLDRRWGLWASLLLLGTFLCPLAGGGQVVFFFDLLDVVSRGTAVVLLAPAVLGAAGLLLSGLYDGLVRGIGLVLVTGLGLILMWGVAEAHLVETADALPLGGLVSAWGFLLFEVGGLFAFVGLGIAKVRPVLEIGPRIAGLGGLMLAVWILVPIGEVTPIEMALSRESWAVSWFGPLSVLILLGFALTTGALLFDRYDPEDMATLGLGLGGLAIVLPAVGVFWIAAAPGSFLMVATTLVKSYGTFIALNALLASGLLGLVLHAWAEV